MASEKQQPPTETTTLLDDVEDRNSSSDNRVAPVKTKTNCCLWTLPVALVLIGCLLFWGRNHITEGIAPPPIAVLPSIEGAVQAATTLQHPNASCLPPPKVLIVGAGAAGMHAAYLLEHLGIDYQVLEAYHDLGGRIRQMTDFIDVPLDMGPEWITVDPRILQDFLLPFGSNSSVETVDIKTFAYQPKTWQIYSRGKLRSRQWMARLYQEYKFWNSTWYAYHRDYIFQHIQHRVKFNAVVKSIDYNDRSNTHGQGVMVTTTDGHSYSGTHVLVATSVNVIQNNHIEFVPPLSPSKRAKFEAVPTVGAVKVWIEFSKKFYPDILLLRGLWSLTTNPYVEYSFLDAVYDKPTQRHALLLFATGHFAEEMVDWDDDRVVQKILSQLDGMFEAKASKYYLQSRVQNWLKEPYIQGAYSTGKFDMASLLEPVQDKLYFAGEYLALGGEPYYQGNVQGAAISGRSVAQQILLDYAARSNASC